MNSSVLDAILELVLNDIPDNVCVIRGVGAGAVFVEELLKTGVRDPFADNVPVGFLDALAIRGRDDIVVRDKRVGDPGIAVCIALEARPDAAEAVVIR